MKASHDPGQPAALALLSLIGADAKIEPSLWHEVQALAASHRVEPYLHARHGRGLIAQANPPEPVVREWAAAYRQCTLENLTKRRAAILMARRLAGEGIPCLVMKGGWLAEFAYAAPGERAMRDIDLMIPLGHALDAYRTLLAEGWSGPDCTADRFDPILAAEAHLPPLVSPEGIVCELHVRPWASRPGLPSNFAGAMWERAHTDAGHPVLSYPAATDTLLHLCVHAAYVHRFDNGPVLVADIAQTVRTHPIDWTLLNAEADRIGATPGLVLCLALAKRWTDADIDLPVETPPDVLHAASGLMAGRVEGRAEAAGLSDLVTGLRSGSHGFAHTLRRRIRRDVRDQVYEDSSPLRLPRRAIAFGEALAKPRVRRDAVHLAQLQRFLRQP